MICRYTIVFAMVFIFVLRFLEVSLLHDASVDSSLRRRLVGFRGDNRSINSPALTLVMKLIKRSRVKSPQPRRSVPSANDSVFFHNAIETGVRVHPSSYFC